MSMKHVLRRVAILSAVAAAAVGFCFFFPTPFVHGILVGIFGGLGSLILGFTILMRRLKKRMEGHLAPPPLPTGSWDYSIELEDLAGNRITGRTSGP